MATDRIGFIGLGRMGGPMARRIHDAGFALTVYDIVDSTLEPFRARDVAIASSPRDVADNAEIVIACIPAPDISVAVALGDDGVIKGRSVKVYLEASTIGADYMQKIDKGFAPTDIDFLDTPISGGVPGAEAGTLSVAAAGDTAALDRARPVISAYADHIFQVAEAPGPAQVAKLINNMLSTSGVIAALEGLVVGAKAGLDVEALLDFINVSTGRNVATMQKIPASVLTRKFGGNIKIGLKDVGLFIKQCEELGIEPFIASRVQEVFRTAIDAGYDKETLRLIEFMEARAGDVIVKGKSTP